MVVKLPVQAHEMLLISLVWEPIISLSSKTTNLEQLKGLQKLMC